MRSLLMRSWLRPPEESGWMTEVMLAETGKKLNTVRSALTMIRWPVECMTSDLAVAGIEQHYPKGISQAYTKTTATLAPYGFRRVQDSFVCQRRGKHSSAFSGKTLSQSSPKAKSWLPASVHDIRAFRAK